jgi:hypothetical protein
VTAPTSSDKRGRAAALSLSSAHIPISGTLDVAWDSPFDRLCYDISASGMARKHRERYEVLLADLTERTGCTEEELLTHGQKVRSVLFFAEDKLGRNGELTRLVGNQQYPYRLAPVTQAF